LMMAFSRSILRRISCTAASSFMVAVGEPGSGGVRCEGGGRCAVQSEARRNVGGCIDGRDEQQARRYADPA
jgi:hypothetical protein